MAEALEVGPVGVNDGVISVEVTPLGGSKYRIEDYLELKYASLAGSGEAHDSLLRSTK